MSRPVTLALLGAGARGELNLASLIKQRPDKLKFVAVAEPVQGRRDHFARKYGINPNNAFADWRELLDKPMLADAVINTLPCRMHYDSAVAAINAGYHMLLEKPMSLEPWQCIYLVELSQSKSVVLGISVQNRYNRIYQRIRSLLDDGLVGQLTNIDCAENIGYWHFILSYVRGIHHRASLSHSFIMAKGIHDIDLLLWFAGAPVKRVASFGSLKFFTKENAPPGAPDRCTDGCPVESSCEFSAIKQYLKPGRPDIPLKLMKGQSIEVIADLIRNPRFRTMASIVAHEDLSDAGVRKALDETNYGRCVFRCPNDVVDHQTASIEFENGATASYSLSGFSLVWERTLNIHGSKGEIRAADFSGRLETRTYNPARARTERIPYHGILHGGGDKIVILEFAEAVKRGTVKGLLIAAESCLDSHLVGFAIEKARRENSVVDYQQYKREARESLDTKKGL